MLRDEVAARSGVLDLVHRAFAGETVTIGPMWYDPRELEHVTVAEGRRVAIASSFFPLFDTGGTVSHVAIVFKDLTTELEAREQAEQERDLMRAIFEQSGDGIIVCDEHGIIRGFNPEAERQHGIERRPVPPAEWAAVYGLCDGEGRPLALADIAAPSRAARRARGERALEGAPAGRQRVHPGRHRPAAASRRRHPAGAVVTTRDETERLRLEEACAARASTTSASTKRPRSCTA